MYIADLHIHSRYSRATSKDGTPEYLDLWARRKGISIVGTGDFTHPAWRAELKEKLSPAEDGFYQLKEEYRILDHTAGLEACPRFVISGEISSIYKKNGRVRKVHSVILLPSLEDAELLSKRLEAIGNLHSDGRPILGLDCHDLLEITLELCPRAIYIPAHIWTPHFSLFGAFSGFDSIEECFGDLTPHIHALETGLSSDPPMNWRLSALDGYQLISNSDAHSPAKLGREANLLDIPLHYDGLARAIETGNGLAGTIEFFPEEGKYHFDGHRKCHLCLSPSQAAQYQGKCPVCGKKLTIGVLHRVEQLADRPEEFVLPGAKPFESLVPLPEVIAVSTGHSAAGSKVQSLYENMLHRLGPEFSILRTVPLEDIRLTAGSQICEGIRRLRRGEVDRSPGFDGEYGVIRLFSAAERDGVDGQLDLFSAGLQKEDSPAGLLGAEHFTGQLGDDFPAGILPAEGSRDLAGRQAAVTMVPSSTNSSATAVVAPPSTNSSASATVAPPSTNSSASAVVAPPPTNSSAATTMAPPSAVSASPSPALNPEQLAAAATPARAIAVIAGPGTGKTQTLAARIRYLLEERRVKPSEITAVTFTNKASAEMRRRLEASLPGHRQLTGLRIGTFHALCIQLLQEQGISCPIADEAETNEAAARAVSQFGLPTSPRQFLLQVGAWKNSGVFPSSLPEEALRFYNEQLTAMGVMDFDDVLLKTLALLEQEQKNEIRGQHFSYLLVDEFQDINSVQYRLIQAWNKGGRELFAIGDPDQSIYGFRGSDPGFFDCLAKDYPRLQTVRLCSNYRSTPEILAGSLPLISHNHGGKRQLDAVSANGCPIRLITAAGGMEQAIFVAKEINRMVGGIDMLDTDYQSGLREASRARSFSDIAVLFRTHRQADLLETCFQKEGIPYVVAGGGDFLSEPIVRGTVCFFRFLLSPTEEHCRRLCRRLLWNLPEKPAKETVEAEERFEQLTAKYQKKVARTKPRALLDAWMQDLELTGNEALEKLAGMAVFYKTMAEFLNDLTFGAEGDLRRCAGKTYPSDAVTLMTLHAAKGLEFSTVFLYDCRKGLLPLENSHEASDTEEERRLFYVGMTRAREELLLTVSGEPSPFLAEIPSDALKKEEARKKEEPPMKAAQLSLFDFLQS